MIIDHRQMVDCSQFIYFLHLTSLVFPIRFLFHSISVSFFHFSSLSLYLLNLSSSISHCDWFLLLPLALPPPSSLLPHLISPSLSLSPLLSLSFPLSFPLSSSSSLSSHLPFLLHLLLPLPDSPKCCWQTPSESHSTSCQSFVLININLTKLRNFRHLNNIEDEQ